MLRKLAFQNKNTFSFDTMVTKLDSIFTQYIPEFAEKVELSLPKLSLPKLNKPSGDKPPAINLPKLKKV